MKITRMGLVGVAAAAALVGCDSGTGELVKSGPIDITPENAPAIAAEGSDMIAGSTSPDSATGDALPDAVELSRGGGAGIGQVMTLGKIAAIIRGHLEQAGLEGGTSLSLPVATMVVEPVVTACPGGGSYTSTQTSDYYGGTWDTVYNSCTYTGSEYGGYYYHAVYNGHVSGTYSSYGGTYTYEYDNFTSRYESQYNGQTWKGNYALDGAFNSHYYGGNTYSYGATGLTISYDYSGQNEETGEPYAARGNVIYDQYQFQLAYNYGGYTWDGYMSARDSTRGAWFIAANAWNVNWCSQTVNGSIIFSGGYEEEEHGGGVGNELRLIGNGTDMVNMDVYNASGGLISSVPTDWFTYDYGSCET